MNKTKSASLSVLFLLMSPFAANADPITYTVDSIIGNGTVTGTITTDGTLGVLAAGHILSWTLTLTAPGLAGGSPDIISGIGAILEGNALTATLTDMFFNFDLDDGDLHGFALQGASGNFWCMVSLGWSCAGGPGGTESMGFDMNSGIETEIAARQGLTSIASTTTVPEPGTLALLGIGLAGIGLARRRKKV